jgi:pimeloyl-ACP methyl ester carboxylesterase
MNPFYFGDSATQLYGVHHPPKGQRERSLGVVLCAPFGQEYMRSHRVFRQLALLLSRAGFHVLRFDYFGTGDSAGHADDVSVAQWAKDVGTAIEELKETADVKRVVLVGLRLGALVAGLGAAGRSDVASVVYWDPVVAGASYLREILGAEAEESAPAWKAGGAGRVGVLGFPVTATLRKDLLAGDLRQARPPRGVKAFVVSSREEPEFAALDATLREGGASVMRLCIPSPGNWNEVDNYGSVLIPQAIIQQIVAYLSNEVGA